MILDAALAIFPEPSPIKSSGRDRCAVHSQVARTAALFLEDKGALENLCELLSVRRSQLAVRAEIRDQVLGVTTRELIESANKVVPRMKLGLSQRLPEIPRKVCLSLQPTLGELTANLSDVILHAAC